MASTFTTSKVLEIQATGENANDWGTRANANFTLIDNAFGGTRSNAFSSADVTLTAAQAANVFQNCTGTASGNNLIVPSAGGYYLVFNNTSGSITVKTASGTGIAVATGKRAWLWCDGTNVNESLDRLTSLSCASVTLTGGSIDGVTIGGTTKAAGSFTNLTVTGSYTFTTPLNVANGGIGAATLSANAVLLGNGTSALQTVAPGTSGNLLTSNGTTWSSTALSAVSSIADAANGGLSFSASTGAVTASLVPNNLTAKTSRAAADSLVINDVAGGNVAKIITFPNALSGMPIQIVNTETGAVATGTTVIPFDDTIPQQSGPAEGDQYMSLAITPTNAASTLIIDVVVVITNSGTQSTAAALFQDAAASALAASLQAMTGAGSPGAIVFRHKMTAGTTSSTTFKVRAGGAGAGTTTFNGTAGGRYFGGVMASSITITEVLP